MSVKSTSTRPTRTEGNGTHWDYEEDHPSFGLMTLHRTHGGDNTLFGSSVKHNEVVSLDIYRATRMRSLSNDHYHQTKHLLSLEMSPVQWAEFVSSFNDGTGTPVTLRSYADEKGYHDVPRPDFSNVIAEIREEFNDTAKKAASQLDDAYKMLQALVISGKPVTKAQVKEAFNLVYSARQNMGSNTAFVVEQFHEQMERTVTEAKGEVEAFVSRKIAEAGLKAIAESQGEKPPVALIGSNKEDQK